MCYPERTQHIFLHNAPELPVGPSTHQADGPADCSGAEDVTLRACGPTERGGTTMQKTVSSGPFADVLRMASHVRAPRDTLIAQELHYWRSRRAQDNIFKRVANYLRLGSLSCPGFPESQVRRWTREAWEGSAAFDPLLWIKGPAYTGFTVSDAQEAIGQAETGRNRTPAMSYSSRAYPQSHRLLLSLTGALRRCKTSACT